MHFDYAGKIHLNKGHWISTRKIMDNHLFFKFYFKLHPGKNTITVTVLLKFLELLLLNYNYF